jgi:hypothetical protein
VTQPNTSEPRAILLDRAREVAALVFAARGKPLPGAKISAEHAEEWVEAVHVDRDRDIPEVDVTYPEMLDEA